MVYFKSVRLCSIIQLIIFGCFISNCCSSPLGTCSLQNVHKEGLLCSRQVVMSLRSDDSLNCKSEYQKSVPVCLFKSLKKCYNPSDNNTQISFTNNIVNVTMTTFSSQRFCSARLIVQTPKNCTDDFKSEYGTCAVLFHDYVVSSPKEPLLCSSYQSMASCLNSTAVKYCGSSHVDTYMDEMKEFFIERNNPFCSIEQLDNGDNHKIISSFANKLQTISVVYGLFFALLVIFS